MCPHCGLLLLQAEEIVTEVFSLEQPGAVVRALLSPRLQAHPAARPSAPADRVPSPKENSRTTKFFTPLSSHLVPRLRVLMDAAQHQLQEFEAYVVSFIDGQLSMAALAQAAGVGPVEVVVVMNRLKELGWVSFEAPEPAPAPAPVEPREEEGAEVETSPTVVVRRPLGQALLGDDDSPTVVDQRALSPMDLEEEEEEDSPTMVYQGLPLHARPALPVVLTPAPVERLSGRFSVLPASERTRTQLTTRVPPPASSPPAPQASAAPKAPAAPVASPAPAASARRPNAEEVMEEAIRLERAGQVEQAIDLLALAIQQVKRPAPLYNKLALILAHQLHEYPRALGLMELALEAAPGNTVYQQNLQMIRTLQASHQEQVAQQRKRVWSALVKGPAS
jgi:hypothetical protein